MNSCTAVVSSVKSAVSGGQPTPAIGRNRTRSGKKKSSSWGSLSGVWPDSSGSWSSCQAMLSTSSLVSGEEAFELHTQEGFLIEMTEAMAARHNLGQSRQTASTSCSISIARPAGKDRSPTP